jgi:hypothetical protein
MEEDIATLSTRIHRDSPLPVEIFLDLTNIHQSLLDGNVRISIKQSIDSETCTIVPPLLSLLNHSVHTTSLIVSPEVYSSLGNDMWTST